VKFCTSDYSIELSDIYGQRKVMTVKQGVTSNTEFIVSESGTPKVKKILIGITAGPENSWNKDELYSEKANIRFNDVGVKVWRTSTCRCNDTEIVQIFDKVRECLSADASRFGCCNALREKLNDMGIESACADVCQNFCS
jgi:hypothetical protein